LNKNIEEQKEVVKVDELSKVYSGHGKDLTVLKNINFTVTAGESLAIIGPSGSGKTTLLGLCAGLDSPSTGAVSLFDQDISKLNEDQRAVLRNDKVGFIFQNFQLIPTLTAIENITIPMELKGMKDIKSTAMNLLERVGLSDRAKHYPNQLSGGEQQRISLARAFSNNPKLLFADEPTGNLDGDTGSKVEDLLFDLNRENGTTLIIVTHDLELASKTQRKIRLKNGEIVEDARS